MILFRADANSEIGSGHVMRCSAVAYELAARGEEFLFVVSDEASEAFVRKKGLPVRIVLGDPGRLGRGDGEALGALAAELEASAIVVDSYAAGDDFFEGLRVARRNGCCVLYFDDLFSFDGGFNVFPRRRDVDMVVNYSFGVTPSSYREIYDCNDASLLVGPEYAPVRDEFRGKSVVRFDEVRSVLVTCGSTNPKRILEKIIETCLEAVPKALLNVVVGGLASCDIAPSERVMVHRDVKNMSDLMEEADLAVSGAGSTLYELAALGVPAIAIPFVENQRANSRGFQALGLGLVADAGPELRPDLVRKVGLLAQDFHLRRKMSERGPQVVDGFGAVRIAELILRVSS